MLNTRVLSRGNHEQPVIVTLCTVAQPARLYLGLTLIEILITVLLTSLLIGLSLPNIKVLQDSASTAVALQRLSKALESAKISAISSGETVTFCGSENSLNCQGSWSEGLLSFIDRNQNQRIDTSDQALNWQSMQDIQGSIRWKAFGNRQYLLLDPRGMMETQNGSFTYCTHNALTSTAAKLVVNRAARSRTLRDLDPKDHCG
jgi:type IV fimbrial biogenesis protein FimT